MEHKVRCVPAEALMEDLLELLEQTEPVPLVISGSSMSPFLVHGRDTVFLVKVKRPLKRGDMILYRRRSGQYILHRIYKAEQDTLTLIGDGQGGLEPGICREQVLALVSAVRRKGKLLKPGNFLWDFYEKVWIRMLRIRPRLLKWINRNNLEK